MADDFPVHEVVGRQIARLDAIPHVVGNDLIAKIKEKRGRNGAAGRIEHGQDLLVASECVRERTKVMLRKRRSAVSMNIVRLKREESVDRIVYDCAQTGFCSTTDHVSAFARYRLEIGFRVSKQRLVKCCIPVPV